MFLTVVVGAPIGEDLQQEAISRAGERGVSAAKIAAAYFWVVVACHELVE